jgi:hypothetical protein
MTAKSRFDMPRHSQLDMSAPVWPEGVDKTKRSALQKQDEEYVEHVREQMQLLRRKATARYSQGYCPLPPCRRHRQCLSRNNPHEWETFCASRIDAFLSKLGIENWRQ